MATTASDLKKTAHAVIDRLPDTATWDDLLEEFRFVQAVEQGLAEADRGEFASPEEVRKVFAKWDVMLET
jgi:predicted transcriptional regulator